MSPSSGAETNSATTMSGVSSSAALGNLHFFEDEDDDDEVFKDLLKPRGNRPAVAVSTTTTTKTTTKAPTPPTKEDSIESVEFDLENSHHEEEEEESIASLEALQSGTEKAAKKKADEGEKEALPKEDKKGNYHF